MSDNNDNHSDNTDIDDNQWLTMPGASAKSGISERTIQRRIKSGKIVSKLEHGCRLILASSLTDDVVNVGNVTVLSYDNLAEENKQLKNHIDQLEEELRQLRQNNDSQRQELATLAEELKQAYEWLRQKDTEIEDSRQRQDAIIMTLTRQLGDAQKVLEMKTMPWWRRLRLNKSKNENKG